MTQFQLGEPEGNPTFDQFQAFARRLGIEVRTRGPFFRKLADRSVVAVDIDIRQAGAGNAAWRQVAPWIHPLEGQDRDGFVARVARPLAWLRFCDLVALPRIPGAGWGDVSVKAVADHLCAMLGLDQPDIRLLECCLAAWRGSGIDGLTPRNSRTRLPGPKGARSKPRRAAEWREIAALVDRISDSGPRRRAPSIPAGESLLTGI